MKNFNQFPKTSQSKVDNFIKKIIMTYPALYTNGGNFETIKNNILLDILFGYGKGYDIKNKTIINRCENYQNADLENWDKFEKILLSSSTNLKFVKFTKNFGLIYKISKSNLTQDWISNFVNVAKLAVENYSKNMNRFSTYKEYDKTYYEIENLHKDFQFYFKNGGIKELNEVQGLWGYKQTNSVPTIEECKFELNEKWILHCKESIEFLQKFIQYHK